MPYEDTYKFARAFDSLEHATHARAALLAASIAPDLIEIVPLLDEAGPTSGNFALDSKDANVANDRSALDAIVGTDDPNEGMARQPVKWSATALLVVHSSSESERQAAESAVCDMPGGQPA